MAPWIQCYYSFSFVAVLASPSSYLKVPSEKWIRDLQNARFDCVSVCSTEMLEFLDSHAKSKGVPKEFLFFPLLTTVASLMGTSTTIEINKKWREPALLWFVIASKKGTNKSDALNLSPVYTTNVLGTAPLQFCSRA